MGRGVTDVVTAKQRTTIEHTPQNTDSGVRAAEAQKLQSGDRSRFDQSLAVTRQASVETTPLETTRTSRARTIAPVPTRIEDVPELDARYTTPAMRARTVTVLGSSKTTPGIAEAMGNAGKLARELVLRGYNVLTGCGNGGVMGAAYTAAYEATQEPASGPRPRGENLAILVLPAWGDEDLTHVRAIGTAKGASSSLAESTRVEKFCACSSTFVAFSPGASTFAEIAGLIERKRYEKERADLKIFLVGHEFDPLLQMYQASSDKGSLGADPVTLFTVVDSLDEVLRQHPGV